MVGANLCLKNLRGLLAILIISWVLLSCSSSQRPQTSDILPMYGQPTILRSAAQQQADEQFIREATASYGSRKEASTVWFRKGQGFMHQYGQNYNSSNLDYAMLRYNQSWLLDPNNYQPFWGFARVLIEQGKFDQAIDNFKRAKELINDPYQEVALLSDMGTGYTLKAKQFPKDQVQDRERFFALANEHFTASHTQDPTYDKVWGRWAWSLYLQGKYKEAWDKVKKGREANIIFPSKFLKDLESKMPDPN